MESKIVMGFPVLLPVHEVNPGKVRVRVKKKLHERTLAKLPLKNRKALERLMELGAPFTNDKKRIAATEQGFSRGHAVETMDRLLARKPIVEEIEKQSLEKFKKKADAKIAEVLIDQLEAVHPLAKDKRKDNLAIINAAKELNKVKDNYPPKQIVSDERVVTIHLSGKVAESLEKYRKMRMLSD